jgi:hypothetical protein
MADKAEALAGQVAKLNDQIKALVVKKDAAAAKYRADLLELNEQRDNVAAELVAVRKVAGLTDTERQALAAELATSGGN